MTDKQFQNIIELRYLGGGFIPENQKAEDMTLLCKTGEIISFIECKTRDIKFHRCYMKFLADCYNYLPLKFKLKVKKEYFYQWLKHYQGRYKIIYKFKDGSKFIEYESIAFGNMSQKRFENYVAEQLPTIYGLIGAFYKKRFYDNIIAEIEENYKKFLSLL